MLFSEQFISARAATAAAAAAHSRQTIRHDWFNHRAQVTKFLPLLLGLILLTACRTPRTASQTTTLDLTTLHSANWLSSMNLTIIDTTMTLTTPTDTTTSKPAYATTTIRHAHVTAAANATASDTTTTAQRTANTQTSKHASFSPFDDNELSSIFKYIRLLLIFWLFVLLLLVFRMTRS